MENGEEVTPASVPLIERFSTAEYGEIGRIFGRLKNQRARLGEVTIAEALGLGGFKKHVLVVMGINPEMTLEEIAPALTFALIEVGGRRPQYIGLTRDSEGIKDKLLGSLHKELGKLDESRKEKLIKGLGSLGEETRRVSIEWRSGRTKEKPGDLTVLKRALFEILQAEPGVVRVVTEAPVEVEEAIPTTPAPVPPPPVVKEEPTVEASPVLKITEEEIGAVEVVPEEKPVAPVEAVPREPSFAEATEGEEEKKKLNAIKRTLIKYLRGEIAIEGDETIVAGQLLAWQAILARRIKRGEEVSDKEMEALFHLIAAMTERGVAIAKPEEIGLKEKTNIVELEAKVSQFTPSFAENLRSPSLDGELLRANLREFQALLALRKGRELIPFQRDILWTAIDQMTRAGIPIR